MNFKTKKEQLVETFNKNQQTILQLSNAQQQIIGQLNLIDEKEKEDASIDSELAKKEKNK